MANIDLTPEPGGNGTNPADENRAAKPADPRVKELEQEVARLRSELGELQKKYERDLKVLHSYMVEGLPRDEKELREFIENPRPFRELMKELEQELGLEPRS